MQSSNWHSEIFTSGAGFPEVCADHGSCQSVDISDEKGVDVQEFGDRENKNGKVDHISYLYADNSWKIVLLRSTGKLHDTIGSLI